MPIGVWIWFVAAGSVGCLTPPQWGKFTHALWGAYKSGLVVSNPNGVNLRGFLGVSALIGSLFQTPNGVNLRKPTIKGFLVSTASFKPQRGKFTQHQNTHI